MRSPRWLMQERGKSFLWPHFIFKDRNWGQKEFTHWIVWLTVGRGTRKSAKQNL